MKNLEQKNLEHPDDAYLTVAAIRDNLHDSDLDAVPLSTLHKFAAKVAGYCSTRLYCEDTWSEQIDETLKSLFPVKPHLRHCPFCGNIPDAEHVDCIYPVFTPKNKPRLVSLNCYESAGGCGAQVLGSSEADVIQRWNTRVVFDRKGSSEDLDNE